MMRPQLPLPTTATLQTLEPEEAILLIHRNTAPHARHLHCISIPWHIIKKVALLALGSLKDQKTIPIARRLVTQRRAVADAAEAFLDAVR